MMNTWVLAVAWAAQASSGQGAAAADAAAARTPALLVIVESGRTGGLEGDVVRRAVERELMDTQVLGPGDDGAAAATRMLLVAADGERVTVSLRTGDAASLVRSIPAPRDRASRARAIAWLTANLTQDPTGEPSAASASFLARVLSENEASKLATPERSSQPPPFDAPAAPVATARSTPARAAEPLQTSVATQAPADPSPPSRWTIGAFGGTAALPNPGGTSRRALVRGNAYRAEIVREAAADGFLLGGAIEVGPADPGTRPHYFGVAALAGSRWNHRGWYVDAVVGLGVELGPDSRISIFSASQAPTGQEPAAVSQTTDPPSLFGRLDGLLGVPVSARLDLLVGAGVHVSAAGYYGNYANAMLGVRVRMP